MKKIGISVIMPVYNAEPFLEECLESILNQTFTNFELICVNDGSSDSSAEILQKYHNLDDRVSILTNNTCQGAAGARNRGMKVASGIYLAFLDSDDIFEADMLELAYDTIEKKQADIVVFEAMHMPTEKIHEIIKKVHNIRYREKYCRKAFYLKEHEPWEINEWSSAPWNKLYRRSFIEEKNLEFQSLPCCNDVYFVTMAFMSEAKMIALDEERVMVHVRDHDSATRISYDRDPMCSYRAIEKIQKELLKRKLFGDVYAHFYYRAFGEFIWAIKQTKSKERAKEFYDFLAQEGIKKLCERGTVYYELNDEYIKTVYKKFESDSFESQWYMQGGRLDIYLKNNKAFFINMIKNAIQDNNRICIWGVGRNGRILIDFLKENRLIIDNVFDRDENKEGAYVGGYEVKNPDYLLHKTNGKYLVIVSSVLAIDDANQMMQESENKITIMCVQELYYSM